MAATQHRGITIDRKSGLDEVEQSMTIKDYRAKKNQVKELEIDDEEFDGIDLGELKYLLGKNR